MIRLSLSIAVTILALSGAYPALADDDSVAGLRLSHRVAALSGQMSKGANDRGRQLGLIDMRLENTRNLRTKGRNANSSSITVRFAGKSPEKSAAFETKNYIAKEKARRTERLAIWMAGDIMVDSARSQNPRMATVYTNGLIVGADARLGPRLLIGNAVGTAFDRIGVGEDGSLRSRYISNTFYGSVFTSADTFLDFAVGGSLNGFSSRYDSSADGRRQHRAASQAYGLARYSRDFKRKSYSLRPYGQARISRTQFQRYGGHGAAAFSYDSQSLDALELTLGLRGETAMTTSVGKLKPNAGIEVTRTMKHASGEIIASINAGRDDYAIRSSTNAYGNVLASTGLDWTINKRTTVTARYGVSASIVDMTPQQNVSARFSLKF